MGAAWKTFSESDREMLERLIREVPPDLADQVVRAQARAERDRLQLGRTRASTFKSLLGGSGG